MVGLFGQGPQGDRALTLELSLKHMTSRKGGEYIRYGDH